MFTARSLTFLLGPLFSKKSWLALDLGVCLAAGLGWPGTDTPSPVNGRGVGGEGHPIPTLHIDEAHGSSETSRRLSAITEYRRTSRDIPFHYSSFPGYALTDPKDVAALTQQALSDNAGLIVIDQPYGSQLPGSPLAASATAASLLANLSPLISSLRSVAESANAAVLFLLQTQTRIQRAALAKALVSLGADHVLGLDFYPTDLPKATPFNKLLPRYRSGYLHLRTLASAISPTAFIPQAASYLGSLINVQFKIHTSEAFFSLSPVSQIPGRHNLRLSTYQAHLGRAGFAILHFLEAQGFASTRDLMVGVTAAVPSRVRTVVHQLAREGYILCIKRGGAHHPAIYALTPMGRSLL